MIFSRRWAMPSENTFEIPCVLGFVERHLEGCLVSIDPFSRNNRLATYRNDINPETIAEHHMESREFLEYLIKRNVKADCIIYDPPYSPRQISECYKALGLTVKMIDTQSSRLKKECKELFRLLLKRGGKVLSFGWNSVGMGKDFDFLEIMLVSHGGDHNDTICIAQQENTAQPLLFSQESA